MRVNHFYVKFGCSLEEPTIMKLSTVKDRERVYNEIVVQNRHRIDFLKGYDGAWLEDNYYPVVIVVPWNAGQHKDLIQKEVIWEW